MMHLLLYYLLAINLLAFVLYGIDKVKAKHKRWRIPEAVLLWLAILGGSPAALVAMHLFHHKTLHKKFLYGVPAILLLQLAAAVYYWYTSMV